MNAPNKVADWLLQLDFYHRMNLIPHRLDMLSMTNAWPEELTMSEYQDLIRFLLDAKEATIIHANSRIRIKTEQTAFTFVFLYRELQPDASPETHARREMLDNMLAYWQLPKPLAFGEYKAKLP